MILYEDTALVVLDKPAGLSSEDGVPAALRKLWGRPDAYVGVIHRLDTGVSGLMVYAKTPQAAAALSRQVTQSQQVYAEQDGRAEPDAGTPDAPPFVKQYRAIIAGGIAIAALYLFSSFGIGAAIPAMDISLDSGIMDAVGIMAGVGSVLFIVVGVVFLITLFGNMVSWSFGVNFVAEHAARKKNMPKVFAHESEKNQMPTGAAIVNGVVASVLVLLSPVMELAGFDGFFWIFFSMNIVFLLISYIPMFPAFLKLRTIDPAANRVFKVPGGRGVALVVAWVPVILLVLAIIATIVPLNGSPEEMSKIPLLIGVIAFVILGELVRIWSARGRKDDYGGMGSSGDPFEFDVAHGYEEMPESEKIAVEEDLIIGREPRDLV